MDKLCISFIFCSLLGVGWSLECYVCTKQDYNVDKCTSTVNTCQEAQTSCLTIVEWKFPPYWTPNGDRIHYITKACDVRADCDRKRNNNRVHCKRDWWNDWSCIDCCNGDRCNYYVTLGASNTKVRVSLLISSVLVALASLKFLQ